MIPQIILVALFVLCILIGANQHGELKTGHHNFWVDVVGVGIHVGLLYWGGFFACWGWGQ